MQSPGTTVPLRRDVLRTRQRRRRTDTPAHGRQLRDRMQGSDPRGRGDGQPATVDALAARASEPLEPGGQAPRHQRRPHRGDRVRRAEGQRRAPAARLRPDLQGKPHHDDDLRLLGRALRQPVGRNPVHPSGDLPLNAAARALRRRPRPVGGTVVVGAAEEAGALDLQQPHRDPGHDRRHERRRIPRPPPHRRRHPPERRRPPGSGRSNTTSPNRPCARARPRMLRWPKCWRRRGWDA